LKIRMDVALRIYLNIEYRSNDFEGMDFRLNHWHIGSRIIVRELVQDPKDEGMNLLDKCKI